jgi:hypothetical protein
MTVPFAPVSFSKLRSRRVDVDSAGALEASRDVADARIRHVEAARAGADAASQVRVAEDAVALDALDEQPHLIGQAGIVGHEVAPGPASAGHLPVASACDICPAPPPSSVSMCVAVLGHLISTSPSSPISPSGDAPDMASSGWSTKPISSTVQSAWI